MKTLQNLFLLTIICITIIACGDNERDSITVPLEYSEELINDLNGTDFSIVLNDMNVEEENGKDLFQHKYHILKVIKDSLVVDSLDWKTVNKAYFLKHENDLGMEIVSNHNNKLSRIAKPVGFDWAVGNDKYGQWEEEKIDSSKTTTESTRRYWRSNHSSGLFWYWMLRRRTYRSDYAANRSYNSTGRTYYGNNTNGTSTYGTNSSYQKSKRSSFFTRKSTSSSYKSYSTRKSASSSRYSGASSTRSKSGGFGK